VDSKRLTARQRHQGDIVESKRLTPKQRHQQFIRSVIQSRQRAEGPDDEAFVIDYDMLVKNHRFLRTDADNDGSVDADLAKLYYSKLFVEFVIADLQQGNRCVGFRWRTENEVVSGKGQFICGERTCDVADDLLSYEVDFNYREEGERKRALVKVRLCEDCGLKLRGVHGKKYGREKSTRKRKREERGGDETTEEEFDRLVKECLEET